MNSAGGGGGHQHPNGAANFYDPFPAVVCINTNTTTSSFKKISSNEQISRSRQPMTGKAQHEPLLHLSSQNFCFLAQLVSAICILVQLLF